MVKTEIKRMLDLEYTCKDNIRNLSKVTAFFKKHNWLMGHYFRSLIHFAKWVEENHELTSNQKNILYRIYSSAIDKR